MAATLGTAMLVWDAVVETLNGAYTPLVQEWKASKSDFGWMCLLKHRGRTLVYLTPEKRAVLIAVVLGERAVATALRSDLPEDIRHLITEARAYAEGRGIRFAITSRSRVSVVAKLVAIKTQPA